MLLVQICRYIELELPDDIERDEVKPVRRVMPLQRPSQRPAGITVGSGARVQQLPRDAGFDVTIDLILETGAVAQLSIERQHCVTLRLRNRRAVVRESCRPQPFFTDLQLLAD